MSENLMRVEMAYGYDCCRIVDVERYADDLTAGGKVYRDRSKRNRMSEIGLGEIWVTYDDNGKTPVFKANVIVKDDGDYSALPEVMAKMAGSIRRIMEVSAKDFAGRVSGIGISADEAKSEIEKAVADKMPGGRVRVDLLSLSGRLMKQAFDTGCMLCGKDNCIGLDEWKAFFDSNVTNDIVTGILRESPVVRCIGDYAEFWSKESMDDIESKFALKIASDGFMRLKSGKSGECK